MSASNWRRAGLYDIGTWGSGGTPLRGTEGYYGGPIPWLKIGDLTDGPVSEGEETITEKAVAESPARWIPAGAVLVAMYGSIGKLGITSRRLTTNQAIAHCVPDLDVVGPRFLFYWFLGQRGRLSKLGKGGTQQNISQAVLRSLEILLPPVADQDRIVDAIEVHLSRLDATVASLTRAKANLILARASVLKAAVEGRLAPTEAELARTEGREYEPASVLLERILAERKAKWESSGKKGKYKEPVAPDVRKLPELPEGWVWSSLGTLVDQPQYGLSLSAREIEDGPRFLRITDIQDGGVRWQDVPSCKATPRDETKYRLANDDIVFARTGATTGKSYLIQSCPSRAVFASYLIRIRPHTSVSPHYLAAFFDAPLYWSQITERSAGIAQPGVNATKLQTIVVPVPPRGEQNRIAVEVDRRLSVLATLEIQFDSTLAHCARLRQSILKQAFEGKLVQ